MKKILLIALFAALLLSLAGCGKKESAEDKLKKAIKDFNEEVFSNSEDASGRSEDSEADDSDDSDKSNIFNDILNSDSSDESDNSDNGEDADQTSEEVSDTEASAVFKDYLVLDSYEQVFNTLKEFSYEYNTKNAGEDPTQWSFEYKYLGNETIDGVETKHYSMTQTEDGEPKVLEGWYDDTWSAVKYKDASGEQTGVNASFAGSTLTMMTQMYCNQTLINLAIYSNDWALDDTLYEVVDTRKENMDLGYGNTEVEIQDIKSVFAGIIMRTGYAQFIDKKIFVILEQETEDGSVAGLTVTKAIPN